MHDMYYYVCTTKWQSDVMASINERLMIWIHIFCDGELRTLHLDSGQWAVQAGEQACE